MIKNITIVSCHSRVGGNLDTCFRRYDTKFVSPNSIGFTICGLAMTEVLSSCVIARRCEPTKQSIFGYFYGLPRPL
ncbi:hypothetical protein [Candidatus Tisiphia endosymbiont of Hybos culiciformis]|uniref:hypothetical protein n=1 Tax=Candidatus Tisiphia endosymbiont of Hybos culiciformis TaxID=3139331 RepID=UPI003CCB3E2B